MELEIHLQHQILLARHLEELGCPLSSNVSGSLAQRLYLESGTTRAFDEVICTRCYALRPQRAGSSQVTAPCTRCLSIPRRRSRVSQHRERPPPVVVTAAEAASISAPSAPRSVFAILSSADLPSSNAKPFSDQPTSHSVVTQTPAEGKHPSDAAHTADETVSTSTAVNAPTELCDLLLSKSAKKRKRLEREEAMKTPSPIAAVPPPPSGSLLAMIKGSGLRVASAAQDTGLSPGLGQFKGSEPRRVERAHPSLARAPEPKAAAPVRFSFAGTKAQLPNSR